MNSFYYYTPILLQKIGRLLTWIIFKFFVRIEIRGDKSFLDSKNNLIFASNHTGELDPAVMSLVLPLFSKFFPLYFVSHPQQKYKSFGWRSYFYGGQFFNMLGAYQIFSGKKNYAFSLQNHIKLLRKGRNVCIFPEGKRSLEGKFLPARGGVGYLSFTTVTPVLPISIKTFHKMTFKDFLLRRKKMYVYVGKLLLPSELFKTDNPKVKDFQEASQKIMDVIEENYNKLP